MMDKQLLTASALSCLVGLGAAVEAGAAGFASTDRFGYDGTVKQYNSLADAQEGVNQVGSDITINNRDLAIRVRSNIAGQTDNTTIMTSWWYTTTGPNNGSGNPSNTREGFLQLVDTDGSTTSSVSMAFNNFNGTHWTEFEASITGSGANPDDDNARLGVQDTNPGYTDGGIYHEYDLTLTATGLNGVETAPGVIESSNHPTDVAGSYSGIFENIRDEEPIFYAFDYQLTMDNWAWDNQDDLTGIQFSDSTFSVVPSPTAAFGGLVMLGGLAMRRRRRA